MKGMLGAIAWLAIALRLAAGEAVAARSGQAVPDPRTVGPQVGSTVPPFTLPDQAGQPRTLQSVMGPKGAILVFFRSADW